MKNVLAAALEFFVCFFTSVKGCWQVTIAGKANID